MTGESRPHVPGTSASRRPTSGRGVVPSGQSTATDKVVVLAYHAVSPCPNPLSVDLTRLRQQLELLLDRGLRSVTFGEVADGVAPRRSFAVTFDDGYASVYDRALPVLEQLGVRATVFLPTSFMGRPEPVWWPGLDAAPMRPDELVTMSWGQVRDLVDRGWEVGSHTVSHPYLRQLDDAALATELTVSKDVCEQETRTPCRTIAYPFGESDERVGDAAREAGYVSAVTMGSVMGLGPYAVRRIGVHSHDTRSRFALKVSRGMRSPVAVAALTRLHSRR